MKNPLHIFCIATAFAFLTSCTDTHEKLVKDQNEYLGELTQITNDIADGKLSSAEASKKIKQWGKKGEKILQRKKAFIENNETAEFDAVAKKHMDVTMKHSREFMAALQKLERSGRLTKEIQEAMENVKQ